MFRLLLPTDMTTQTPSTPRYRPFVLTKKAEREALKNVALGTSDAIDPVYVVSPRDWDYEEDRYKKTLDEHLSAIPADLTTITGVRQAHIDVSFVEVDGLRSDGRVPIEWLVSEAREHGLILAPMVTAASSAATIDAVRNHLASAPNSSVGVRLTVDDWPTLNGPVLAGILDRLDVPESRLDLFLDAEESLGTLTARAVVGEVSHLGTGRAPQTLTFVGSAWPKQSPAGSGNHEIPRSDFSTYRQIGLACIANGLRLPDYGDWTVSHSDPTLDVDPKVLNISAQFRYAAEDLWVLGKGGLYKGNGGRSLGRAAVPPMLNALVSHPLYGSTIPTGAESWIEEARLGGKSGNTTTWRQWAILRHLELTAHQLATTF